METDNELVTAQRADRGADLWTAVEAIQFAHVFERDDREIDVESDSADAFLALFFELAEDWDKADTTIRRRPWRSSTLDCVASPSANYLFMSQSSSETSQSLATK